MIWYQLCKNISNTLATSYWANIQWYIIANISNKNKIYIHINIHHKKRLLTSNSKMTPHQPKSSEYGGAKSVYNFVVNQNWLNSSISSIFKEAATNPKFLFFWPSWSAPINWLFRWVACSLYLLNLYIPACIALLYNDTSEIMQGLLSRYRGTFKPYTNSTLVFIHAFSPSSRSTAMNCCQTLPWTLTSHRHAWNEENAFFVPV